MCLIVSKTNHRHSTSLITYLQMAQILVHKAGYLPHSPFLVINRYQQASLVPQLVKNPPTIQETPNSIPGLGGSPGEEIGYSLQYSWASLVAQMVKNLPAMWETWARSLGWEDCLEKGKATHSSILAWRIPWDRRESNMTEHHSLPYLSSCPFSGRKDPFHSPSFLLIICLEGFRQV